MSHLSGATRVVAAVQIACVLGGSTAAAQDRTERLRAAVAGAESPLVASARRQAAAQPLRDESAAQGSPANPCQCRASTAEKLAWLFALVGGSIMVVTGPGEREGDVWTVDGKSETVAGAAAVVLSFFLLKDIRSKRATAPAAANLCPAQAPDRTVPRRAPATGAAP
jgi:hypothetical protein